MAATPQELLTEATCYLCNGVTLEEALELALLARIAAAPPAPVLSFSDPNLNWTFAGTNPTSWSIQESPDGITGWAEVDTAVGSARSAVFTDHGVAVRIVGVGPETPASNVIIVN